MTSPPPSETGATVEAMAKALIVLSGWSGDVTACPHAKNVRACYCIDCLQVRVALALEAAKRSAHLEDARAGCEWCAVADPVWDETFVQKWVHATHDRGTQLCRRPEVWDAIKSTASEQPDGKTR